jgi:hypothetical protein
LSIEVTLEDVGEDIRFVPELLPCHEVAAGILLPPHVRLYPVSYGQEAIWLTHYLDPAGRVYGLARAASLRGPINVPVFQRSFDKLMARHPIFSATFVLSEGRLMQRTDERALPRLQVVDAAGWAPDELHRRLRAEALRPFDLARGPLLRVTLFTHPEGAECLIAAHHIICDLWTMMTFIHEWEILGRAECAGTEARLPSPALYEAYVLDQIARMEGPDGQAWWNYWKQQLAGPLPPLDLPTDHPRPAIQTYRGAAQYCWLEGDLGLRIADLATRYNTTSFAVLLAAFQVLLHHYSRQDQILVGSPRANRTAQFARTSGYFINPVVLRADLSGAPRFADFLAQVSTTTTESFAHGDYPFPLLVRKLGLARETNRSPLYQVMFSWQKTSRVVEKNGLAPLFLSMPGPAGQVAGLELLSIPLEQDNSPLDLTLSMTETATGLAANLEYNRDLFEQSTICRMLGDYQRLLASIVDNPDRSVEDLLHTDTMDWEQICL